MLTKTFKGICAGTIMMSASLANASIIYLDFEGVIPTYPSPDAPEILDFYNGGTAANGTSGPDLGVEFTSGAQALCMNTVSDTCSNTSRGGAGIPASRFTAMFFSNQNPFMNVAAGFDTGFSFTYADPFNVGTTVTIYDGLNGTGTVLASSVLPGTPDGLQGGCDPIFSANYCPFAEFGLTFNGTAKSVLFGGQVNRQTFDDFTFGSDTPGGEMPLPSPLALLGLGLLGLRAFRKA